MSCPFPSMLSACSLRCLATSISTAPPPATTERDFSDCLTTISASWILRSLSAMNCSEPPLRTIVDVRLFGQPVNKLNRSSPTCFSSKSPHVPNTPSNMPFVLVWTVAPVAIATRLMSPSSTRPAQNRPRSAKYCVARSPIGSLLRTMLAPHATQLSSLSYITCHSASTMLWYCSGSSMRTSAFSFSFLSSSSTFRSSIFGLLNFFVICSNPAYENVFLKATPLTRNDDRTSPPGIFLIPIMPRRSSRPSASAERDLTASTIIGAKRS
mmetsp:Transcript_1085/g.2310  ORF Transcript_1085/g.2310 Transcript_1085/m.2310 type:complete len:268 (-) Transcript_1085:540-1343(-)